MSSSRMRQVTKIAMTTRSTRRAPRHGACRRDPVIRIVIILMIAKALCNHCPIDDWDFLSCSLRWIGTKTFRAWHRMSAFGCRADMTVCGSPLSRSLLGVKQTSSVAPHMSASDPKRTSLFLKSGRPERWRKLLPFRVRASGAAMKRREFVTFLGGAAALWADIARAQQPDRTRVIGVLLGLAADDPEGKVRYAAFQ